MSILTQGTIIQYIRSNHHPNIKCGGIVINARCDFAQNKIKYVSMLSCMSLQDWIIHIAYFDICESLRQNKYSSLKGFCEQYKLNQSILMELGIEKAKKIIENCGAKPGDVKKLLPRLKELMIYENNLKNPPPEENRREFVKENLKSLKDLLTKLHNGNLTKYCFIPKKAYNKGTEIINDGIVVDLLDLVQISFDDCQMICEGKCDCRSLDPSEQQRLNAFLLLDGDGFVYTDRENLIISPWIEHLLQHFSQAYTRIGVENANKEDIDGYCLSF